MEKLSTRDRALELAASIDGFQEFDGLTFKREGLDAAVKVILAWERSGGFNPEAEAVLIYRLLADAVVAQPKRT